MEEPINANIELLHGETDMGSSSAVTRYLENTVHLNSRYYIPDRQAVSCAVLMSNLMRGRFFYIDFPNHGTFACNGATDSAVL